MPRQGFLASKASFTRACSPFGLRVARPRADFYRVACVSLHWHTAALWAAGWPHAFLAVPHSEPRPPRLTPRYAQHVEDDLEQERVQQPGNAAAADLQAEGTRQVARGNVFLPHLSDNVAMLAFCSQHIRPV